MAGSYSCEGSIAGEVREQVLFTEKLEPGIQRLVLMLYSQVRAERHESDTNGPKRWRGSLERWPTSQDVSVQKELESKQSANSEDEVTFARPHDSYGTIKTSDTQARFIRYVVEKVL